jgi:hypothetical protein
MNEIEVVLPSGAKAKAVDWKPDVLSLICPSAFAPGQPVELEAQTEGGETIKLIGKSGGSKKREDGAFDVKLRLHSLRREQRTWLDAVWGRTEKPK